MSITDKLRTGGIYRFPSNRRVFTEEELTAIADRIDAEHEADVSTACRLAAGLDDDALAKRGYIALPVDADGVPIHVGDSIEIIGGEDGVAVAIELCEDGGWNVSMRPTGWDTPTLFAAESVRHHHAPTVEDVLREFAANIADVLGGDDFKLDDNDELYAEFAKRLRLTEEVDA